MPAAVYVAKAKPDGYTIGHIGNQIITAELSGEASGYTMDELRPICQVGMQGLVIAVPPILRGRHGRILQIMRRKILARSMVTMGWDQALIRGWNS